jgi:hypothetical protein
MFRWGIVSSIVTVLAILVGMRFGSIEAIAIAYGVALVFVLSYPHFAIPGRLIGVSPLDVARTVFGVALAALFMGGAAYGLGKLTATLPKGADLALRIGSAGVVYLTFLKLLRVRVYLELRALARARLLAWAGADAAEPSQRQSK